MKREGRQHGMVRTHPILSEPWNPRPRGRSLNEISSPPTAGPFTRVPTRPTNHSKFTGKCARPKCRDCHILPACKSKEKTKGSQKNRSSSDTMSSYRLITWRVVDAAPGFKSSGFSASGVLDYLGSDEFYMDRDCEADVVEKCRDHNLSSHGGMEIEEVDEEDKEDDDDGMSFYEVGRVWEHLDLDGDDSWCLVEEM